MYTIPRAHVGTITENGAAFCFGAALSEDHVVYLDVAGPTETIQTIRAKLVSKGRLCYLNPPQGRTIYLTPDGTKSLDVFQKKIAYGLVHALFIHQSVAQPLYGELSTTYLIQADPQQASARLGQHIHRLLPIPVREAWYPYLWQTGRTEGLVTACQTYGGVALFRITLDRSRWQTLIQSGLRRGHLTLEDPAT